MKPKPTPDENDFAALDTWAQTLPLHAGRPLTPTQRRKESRARRPIRPAKLASAKSKRVMISIPPTLLKSASLYAQKTHRTLSGPIAESLTKKNGRKTS
ncbi:MAG TPA: hypothetical protein VFE58_04440 [Tepidisphaeraceae bacterium]|jgi:hypothetical protein|nr:hypothetical protein [Tepidisphaeraceae bacterium]